MDRRSLLKLAGLGVIGVGAYSFTPSLSDDEAEAGPLPRAEWHRVFEDTFDGGSIDDDHWSVGWGWGRTTEHSPTRIVDENVILGDGELRLQGTHEGDDVRSGGVHTKNKVTFGPGSYVEARIKFAGRVGFLNAFWAKPNSEAWPPEIDVVELTQDGSGRADTHVCIHTLHYSESTRPGDETTHRTIQTAYEPGDDLTKNFHIYGLEWHHDRIAHYVDGRKVREWTNTTMLEAMQRGAPFYVMLSLDIDRIGTADRSTAWGEALVVDWVRLWENAVR